MNVGRILRSAAALAAAPVLLAGLAAAPANAHGTLGNPISRVAACYQEGPEQVSSEMCVRLVQENGTQPLYDWHEVNLANADGRHREIIPDGELCSAGRDKYSALDHPGSWRTTALPAGGSEFTFEYTAAVPHKGYIEYYVTRDGWDPNTPLAWGDLEPEPFAVHDRPVAENGIYSYATTLPEKSGEHLIYSIWQRTDSPEAFYTCSDVTFGDGVATTPVSDDEGFRVDEDDLAAIDHGDHTEDVAAEETTVPEEPTETAEETEEAAPAADEANPPAAHDAHAADRPELPRTGGALTGLFAAALTLMAAGAGTLWLVRRRQGA
ncbi:lytic polysaccharide monooxygenase [Nocardiopsis sp. N85]|uniref:lytic polysaccharide monooxygenase n=1 Tax=Nocardiopsis sp. N85 TaxID=3029400 RepID=UPI00237F9824|nr:lytic polysaccharide monooxygenase [Nocardiopsis sp. N85]MDE3721727.1 lytic polysaccharide monooxygenase [Nocardiopsis sp. N85]